MSTRSNCCNGSQIAQIVTGVLLATGVAALVWFAVSRHISDPRDPLDEADRRINELENSLHRLQESFGQTVRS